MISANPTPSTLTDGLDSLAIVPIMIVAGCFALITYLVDNVGFADYLQLHHIPESGELAIFWAAAGRRKPFFLVVQCTASASVHG